MIKRILLNRRTGWLFTGGRTYDVGWEHNGIRLFCEEFNGYFLIPRAISKITLVISDTKPTDDEYYIARWAGHSLLINTQEKPTGDYEFSMDNLDRKLHNLRIKTNTPYYIWVEEEE